VPAIAVTDTHTDTHTHSEYSSRTLSPHELKRGGYTRELIMYRYDSYCCWSSRNDQLAFLPHQMAAKHRCNWIYGAKLQYRYTTAVWYMSVRDWEVTGAHHVRQNLQPLPESSLLKFTMSGSEDQSWLVRRERNRKKTHSGEL